MNLLNHLRRARAVRRLERRTIEELSWCSDRDLADMGISRADIPDIARATAQNTVPPVERAPDTAASGRLAGTGGLASLGPAGRGSS